MVERYVSGSLVAALRLQQLGDEALAENAEDEQGSEQHHGVDALPALLVPVVVFEVEPQRELVQGQRGAAPVHGRGHQRCPALFVRSDLEQPQIADLIRPVMPKVMWWMCRPPGVMFLNGPRSARIAWVIPRTAAKVTKKGARREQLALLAPIAEVLVVERAQILLGARA